MYKDTYQQTPERIAFKKWLDETKPGWQGGKGNLWKELTKEHIETLWVAFLAGCRAGEGRKRGEMASDERKYSYDSYCEKLAEGFLVDEPKRTPDDVKELAQVYSYFFFAMVFMLGMIANDWITMHIATPKALRKIAATYTNAAERLECQQACCKSKSGETPQP